MPSTPDLRDELWDALTRGESYRQQPLKKLIDGTRLCALHDHHLHQETKADEKMPPYYYSVKQKEQPACGAYATAGLLGLLEFTPTDILEHYNKQPLGQGDGVQDLEIDAANLIYEKVKRACINGYCSPSAMRDVITSFNVKAVLRLSPDLEKASKQLPPKFQELVAGAETTDNWKGTAVGQIVTTQLTVEPEVRWEGFHFMCYKTSGGIYDSGAGFGKAWPEPFSQFQLPQGYKEWVKLWITVEP